RGEVPARDREEGRDRARATHRLEAFSDIVIGFSLAEIGLSLVVPPHAIDFVARPTEIFAFVVTFIVVVRFWWVHDLIFEHYFVPNRAMTACNFIALASLILQVFCLQFYLHFVPLNEGAVASRIYFAFFAVSYGVQGLMLALGLVYRRHELPLQWRRNGIRELLSRTGLVAGSILGNVSAVTNDLAKVYVQAGKGKQILVANLPNSIFVYAIVGSLTGVALAAIALRFIPALRVPVAEETA
ncbi:MAG: DUF1211 domain-containing protein, partial [Candidatus Eremiobacteraeota bacterium]|nr:DUF1211 domain-containing protein [Candidatus Eremiobacteraeota bacterium]